MIPHLKKSQEGHKNEDPTRTMGVEERTTFNQVLRNNFWGGGNVNRDLKDEKGANKVKSQKSIF